MKYVDAPLSLRGLEIAPPQTYQGIQLIPLIRNEYRGDLRLSLRSYDDPYMPVRIDSKTEYTGYIPHGMIANWTKDDSAVFGTQLSKSTKSIKKERFHTASWCKKLNRTVKREGKQQIRFLPMHVAMEGFLMLHFGGPSIAWSEYSRTVQSHGLCYRCEMVTPGSSICGLEEAMSVFEIHQNQSGLCLLIDGKLASVFVVPHPEDYKDLHRTLLEDFYSELFSTTPFIEGDWSKSYRPEPVDANAIGSLDDLENAVSSLRDRWSETGESLMRGVLNPLTRRRVVYEFAHFKMQHILSELDLSQENYVGEVIESQDGLVQYAKTYRLSANQTRRAYLLSRLAEHQWSLESCAVAENCTHGQLCLRLEKAGFGYLLHQHVLDAARAADRKKNG